MQGKLIASSPTIEGLTKCLNEYFMSRHYSIDPVTYQISNARFTLIMSAGNKAERDQAKKSIARVQKQYTVSHKAGRYYLRYQN